MTTTVKPPTGIYPQRLWLQDRIEALSEAIERYKEVDKNCDDFIYEMDQHKITLEILDRG